MDMERRRRKKKSQEVAYISVKYYNVASKVQIHVSLLLSWNGMEWNLELSGLAKIHRPPRV